MLEQRLDSQLLTGSGHSAQPAGVRTSPGSTRRRGNGSGDGRHLEGINLIRSTASPSERLVDASDGLQNLRLLRNGGRDLHLGEPSMDAGPR